MQELDGTGWQELLHALSLGDVTGAERAYLRAAVGHRRPFYDFLAELARQPAEDQPPPQLLEDAATYHYYSFYDDKRRARLLVAMLDRYAEIQRALAFARVVVLFNRAYDICDRQRSEGHAEWRDVRPLLIEHCAGLPEKCYSLAYERGMIDTR